MFQLTNEEKLSIKERMVENTNQYYAFIEKYTYYILAINAACIGFAVNLSKEYKVSFYLIPLALAIICWMWSFYLGLRKLNIYELIIGAAYRMYEAKFNEEIEIYSSHSQEWNKLTNKFRVHSKRKMQFLYGGIVIFILWNILYMFVRTGYLKQ